ncbi:LysR family transcriptional regulator [uncultured Deinococcus sp.]|uniref:LysR family transcriptional regulator n=1 Tax=uncultured Deinococcus sp. TaxID=158789 RepID=UPI0025CD48B4|nr:LysR family transcriptional regulator [uncultured Deinococcus sp.]
MAPGRPTTSSFPTLAQLRSLIAVADAGGFSEAAAELGVSQSSLSEAVAKLEDVVGRPLLRRSPAGTVVTPAGARVLAHARTAVQAAGDVLLAAQDDRELAGVLRVASFRSTATHLLPPVLAAFRRDHPAVTVRLLDGEADGGGEAQVRDGQADIALVVGEAMPGLRLTPLLDDEYLFVAPESRGPQPVTFEELTASALLLPPGLNSCHVRVQSYLRPLGISPAAVTEIDQDSVILGMVRHGLGVTVMPRLALLPLPEGLVALPLPQSLTRPLAVAALPHRAHLPVIRTFTAALLDSLKRADTRPGDGWRPGQALLH